MSPTLRLALIVSLPLALTACGGAEKKQKDQRTAAGQILPGSISDAMLQYDTVRSQPPLAPEEIRKSSPKSAAAKPAASDAAAAEPAAPAAPAEAPATPAEAAD